MIFSYGFLERTASSAREMLLSLDIPTDDPLRFAKKAVARQPPGVRLYASRTGEIGWESKYVWWACANKEDGLEFEFARRHDGTRQLHVLWKGNELDPAKLQDVLLSDTLQDIYRLRAVITIQQRLEEQGRQMEQSEAVLEQYGLPLTGRPAAFDTISKLQSLEGQLLSGAYEALENEVGGNLSYLSLYLQQADPA